MQEGHHQNNPTLYLLCNKVQLFTFCFTGLKTTVFNNHKLWEMTLAKVQQDKRGNRTVEIQKIIC